jgi:hypothetical protein
VTPETVPTLRLLSLGAGVQSTTLLLLAAEGRLPGLDGAIFADTGSEPAGVYEHLDRLEEQVAKPASIPIYRVSYGNLGDDLLDPNRLAMIPAYTLSPDGDKGMLGRKCTQTYKLRPLLEQVRLLLGASASESSCRHCEATGNRLAPWRAKRGEDVTGPCSVCHGTGTVRRVGQPPTGAWAEQWIGFSTDEISRVSDRGDTRYSRSRHPLLELDMSREQCIAYLAHRGWGSVAKSACTFCPYHGNREWRNMRDNDPGSWKEAVEFDRAYRTGPGMNSQRFLHISVKPLDQAPIGCDPPGRLRPARPARQRLCAAPRRGRPGRLLAVGLPIRRASNRCRQDGRLAQGRVMSTVHICRPATIAVRRITYCPTCERRRRFAAFDALWYGPTWACLGCGERFGDGERLERPFKPRWREESKKRARELWDEAVRLSSPEHRAWLGEQMAPYVPAPVEDIEVPDLKTAAAADAPATTATTPTT